MYIYMYIYIYICVCVCVCVYPPALLSSRVNASGNGLECVCI